MAAPADHSLLSRLTDLAACREPAAFLAQSHELLRTLVPHRTAVAWHGMTASLLGDEVQERSERAKQATREFMRHESTELAPPRPALADGVLTFVGVNWLGGGVLLAALGDPPPSSVRILTPEHLRRAADHFERMLRPQGWEHALLVPLHASDGGLSAGLVLYRTAEEGAFDAVQAARIEALRPFLASLMAHLLEHQQQRSTQADILEFLSELPVGLMLLDWRWRPLFVNEEGYRQAQLWHHAPADPPRGEARNEFRLPPDIREACERLHRRWLEDALGIASANGALNERVQHPLRRDMRATVTIAQTKSDPARPPGMLVRYSGMAARVEPAFQPSSTQLSVLSQLTPSERNVALLVMRGMSNQAIADALHRDITTVKGHLSQIYDKLGIRGRTQLVAMLAG